MAREPERPEGSDLSPGMELQLSEEGDVSVLRSPEVGWFTCALPRGAVVAPGESAGVLTALGASHPLRVPAGAHGTVVSDAPDLVRKPVGFGDVLYTLSPAAESAAQRPASRREPEARAEGRVLRAPQSGRFYQRPAPSEPPFVSPGTIVKDGQPVGMIEVMKTFSHVSYRATGGLPAVARIVGWKVKDGADVKAGDALLEVEQPPPEG